MASIKIIEAGFYTSIQDQGRMGFANQGIPESGAMDQEALRLSNLLLHNPPQSAVLECTLMGPKIKFVHDQAFVLTGAISTATLEHQEVTNNRVYVALKNQVLDVSKVLSGCRTYVGLDGGIDTIQVLGSRSLFYPITSQSRLQKGDALATGTPNFKSLKGSRLLIKNTDIGESSTIKVTRGPEFQYLSETKQQKLSSITFTVNSWNRMGIQLQEPLEKQSSKIITGPVLPGTVQLTPSGRLFILMRDCQVTGGYPRILQLSQLSINRMAQKKTGDRITLSLE